METSERTVFITGSTSGLGLQLAGRLASDGWTVLAHGRDPGRLEALRGDLGPRVRTFVADLASLAETARLAENIARSVERLDVLVNNAGVGFGPPGQRKQLSLDGHELRMAVNYLAPVVLTRHLLKLLDASAPARVVNVGSLGQAAFDPADLDFAQGYNGVAAYQRSKLALAAFTFDLADELPAHRVTVNCLHPASLMPTAMVAETGMAPMSTVEQGTQATLRLVTDPELEGVTGHYFDGQRRSRALREAYHADFRTRLRAATQVALGDLQA
jgi:NAD(P)-dependent dehydrogenase (short-subunit alcohol dehydrogenase family)